MFGISRQAYHKRLKKIEKLQEQRAVILDLIKPVRKKMHRIGTIKIYDIIKNDMTENPLTDEFPEGHIEIKNLISSPAIMGGEAVGFILLGNSDKRYGSADLNVIENFSSQYALAIQRMWFEQELIESEKKYRDMFDNVADMLYIYDLNGNILEANKSFKKLLVC